MAGEEPQSQVFGGLLFTNIFQAFVMARQASKLFIAFVGLTVICIAGRLMDVSRTVVATPGTHGTVTELQTYMAAPVRLDSYIEALRESGDRTGVFSTLWRFSSAKFHETLKSLFALDTKGFAANIYDYLKAIEWTLKYHPVYSVVFLLITLSVISIVGGAICRIAALQFACGEKPGLTEALSFSLRKSRTLLTIPLAPVAVIVLIGTPIVLLGLLGNIDWAGELIVSVLMLPALILGAVVAIALIGTGAGFNLMFPAVAYDGLDCPDSISTSFHYVCQRPWRMGFYSIIAAAYGSVCYVFVRLFAFLMLWVTHWLVRSAVWTQTSEGVNKLAAIWPEPTFANLLGAAEPVAPAGRSMAFAASAVHLLLLVVVGLLVSYGMSFYFSANTIIYALMRNKVDNVALDNVCADVDQTKVAMKEAEVKPDEIQSQQ